MTREERVKPLMDSLRELDSVMTWKGHASIDPARPERKDVILQHWFAADGQPTRSYIVRIFADGSGWDVFRPVSYGYDTQETLRQVV